MKFELREKIFPHPPEIIHAWFSACDAESLSFGCVTRSSRMNLEHELLIPLSKRGSRGNNDLSSQYFSRDLPGGNGTTPVTNRYVMHPTAHRSTALVYSALGASVSK
jgi:hypothetical protein